MSTYKICCSSCQQHIEYDPQYAGMEINCPSCQRPLSIPPLAAGTGMRLSQTEGPAQPAVAAPGSNAGTRQRRATKGMYIAGGAIVLVGLVLAFVVAKPLSRQFAALKRNAPGTEAQAAATRADTADAAVWTMDFAAAEIPDAAAHGSVGGSSFQHGRATLFVGGSAPVLSLRTAADSAYRELLIQLSRRAGPSLDGQSWIVKAEDPPGSAKVIERWEAGGGFQQRTFDSGFVLNLELGKTRDGVLPGKVFVALPDAERSYVAGSFRAHFQTATPQTTSSPAASGSSASQQDQPKRGPASVILKQRAREFGGDRNE